MVVEPRTARMRAAGGPLRGRTIKPGRPGPTNRLIGRPVRVGDRGLASATTGSVAGSENQIVEEEFSHVRRSLYLRGHPHPTWQAAQRLVERGQAAEPGRRL